MMNVKETEKGYFVGEVKELGIKLELIAEPESWIVVVNNNKVSYTYEAYQTVAYQAVGEFLDEYGVELTNRTISGYTSGREDDVDDYLEYIGVGAKEAKDTIDYLYELAYEADDKFLGK